MHLEILRRLDGCHDFGGVVIAADDDAAVVPVVLFNHDNLSTLDELEPAAENAGTVSDFTCTRSNTRNRLLIYFLDLIHP